MGATHTAATMARRTGVRVEGATGEARGERASQPQRRHRRRWRGRTVWGLARRRKWSSSLPLPPRPFPRPFPSTPPSYPSTPGMGSRPKDSPCEHAPHARHASVVTEDELRWARRLMYGGVPAAAAAIGVSCCCRYWRAAPHDFTPREPCESFTRLARDRVGLRGTPLHARSAPDSPLHLPRGRFSRRSWIKVQASAAESATRHSAPLCADQTPVSSSDLAELPLTDKAQRYICTLRHYCSYTRKLNDDSCTSLYVRDVIGRRIGCVYGCTSRVASRARCVTVGSSERIIYYK